MTSPSALPPFLYKLRPQYHARVWGGQRLKPVSEGETPIGEAWVVYEGNAVEGGPRDGQTVKDVLAELGDTFLGEGVSQRFGGRFPLLIKLLDCADWLSVQVHPNDEQARELVGEGEFGKTEAWNFIAADPGAKILAGVKAGTSPEELATAIRSGKVLEVAEEKRSQRATPSLLRRAPCTPWGQGRFFTRFSRPATPPTGSTTGTGPRVPDASCTLRNRFRSRGPISGPRLWRCPIWARRKRRRWPIVRISASKWPRSKRASA